MTVQNLWPLGFLLLIPVIICLYLLKQKAKEEVFSSSMLWQEIYKNLEARTPFDKLKQNLLMYLQILLMLMLILALMAPVLKKGGKAQEHTILVIDNSASMQFLYEGDKTRLDHSIEEAKREIDGLGEDTVVTLISCSDEASVIYQGKDKHTLKKRLDQMEQTEEPGTLDLAAGVVSSTVQGLSDAQVICYTDTEFSAEDLVRQQDGITLIVQDVYSEGENCSVDYVNYAALEEGVEALCRVTNYGEQETTRDVSLYAGTELLDVQTVTVQPGESENVYFEKQKLKTDGSVTLTAELAGRDALMADNRQSIALTADEGKRVLLLSDGNVFLERALSLRQGVELYKSDSEDVLGQEADPYDLYVLDGRKLPEDISFADLSKDAGVLVFGDASGVLEGAERTGEENGVVLTFQDSEVTRYLDGFSFGVTQAFTYDLPEQSVPLLKTDAGQTVGYCVDAGEHRAAVVGFDIHNTDLALKPEFPIFMSQVTDYLLGAEMGRQEIVNFPVAAESDVTPVDPLVSENSQKAKKTGGRAIRNLILLIALLLLTVEWCIYHFEVHASKKKQYLAVRGLVMVLIVLAMAGLSISKKQKKTETIFLVDVSDSMSGNRKEVESYLQKAVSEMPEKNFCGIVTFGKDTAVEQFLSDRKIFSEFTAKPVTTATNIEKAVQAAVSMFDEDAGKRLVLLTDGCENEGNMSLAAAAVKGSEIELLGIAMEDSIGGNEEVYIDGLEAPRVIHDGDHFNVSVSVVSNVETDAVLSLYAGRNLRGQQTIQLNKGRNRFVFEDEAVDGTIASYRAVIEPEQDTISVNNTFATFAQIEARPKILLVEGTPGEGQEFEKVLKAANVDYDKVTPAGTPVTLAELTPYKAVVTLNVHYGDLRQGFVTALDSFVRDYAGGYICIGGDNSYALGSYRGTVLEELLPVRMDLEGEKEIPKLCMAMVIDQSGSMTSPASDNSSVTGLDLAKQAAVSGVRELRETDEVGVLAFDDTYHWIVPISPVGDPESVNDQIRTIAEGGGTSIYPAFREAYTQVLKSDAKLKHIILLTDGQDEFRDYNDLINMINEAGITVSTVAVGEGADKALLQDIAGRCGGRYYYTDINNSIPRIFAQEVYLSTNTYLVNEPFYPTVASQSEMLEGVMDEGCPAILGYVAATPKELAQVVLLSDRGDPLLASWQCGLGRTVAWTSDGNNEWTAECATWDRYPTLWSNIIHYVISDTGFGEDDLEIVKEGTTATISYETKEYDRNTKVTAVVTGEDGETREIPLDAVKPGAFEGRLDMDAVGIYSVNVRKQEGDQIQKSYNTAYANQYSVEYKFAESELPSFLKQAGGKTVTMEDTVWGKHKKQAYARISLTMPLLILAMLLFLADIAIRRFSLDLAAPFYWISGRVGAWKERRQRRGRDDNLQAVGKTARKRRKSGNVQTVDDVSVGRTEASVEQAEALEGAGPVQERTSGSEARKSAGASTAAADVSKSEGKKKLRTARKTEETSAEETAAQAEIGDASAAQKDDRKKKKREKQQETVEKLDMNALLQKKREREGKE